MPLQNYFEGDPDFTAAQEAELVRTAAALRSVHDSMVKLNAPLAELQAIAAEAERLAAMMKSFATVRPVAAHNKLFKPHDVSWSGPYSPVAGRLNPLSPPMHLKLENNRAIGIVTFGDSYEGPPDCVHGGMIALAWDHVLALSNMLIEERGPTASLQVSYRRPTPLNTELRFEGWVEKVEGRKIYTRGQCFANGEVVTEAEGLFINAVIKSLDIDPEKVRQTIIHSDLGES